MECLIESQLDELEKRREEIFPIFNLFRLTFLKRSRNSNKIIIASHDGTTAEDIKGNKNDKYEIDIEAKTSKGFFMFQSQRIKDLNDSSVHVCDVYKLMQNGEDRIFEICTNKKVQLDSKENKSFTISMIDSRQGLIRNTFSVFPDKIIFETEGLDYYNGKYIPNGLKRSVVFGGPNFFEYSECCICKHDDSTYEDVTRTIKLKKDKIRNCYEFKLLKNDSEQIVDIVNNLDIGIENLEQLFMSSCSQKLASQVFGSLDSSLPLLKPFLLEHYDTETVKYMLSIREKDIKASDKIEELFKKYCISDCNVRDNLNLVKEIK